MNKLRSKELKRIARQNLTGNYQNMMGGFLLIVLISFVIDLPFSMLLDTVYATTAQKIMYYVAEILISLIMSVLQIGLIHMHIMLINRKPVRATDVFFCIKNHSDRFFGGAILYFVFSTIAQAPMIIARIFIGLSYEKIMTDIALIATSAILMIILSLALPLYYYVLITDEQLSVFKCLTKAVSLMKGNVLRLIYIELSFIGMFVLGILSLGIGFLWIEPYYQQTITCMYMEITGKLPDPHTDPVFDQYV